MRRAGTGLLLATILVASGCSTREDHAYRDWERRHPNLAAIADCTEVTAYVVLDVVLHGVALALSR